MKTILTLKYGDKYDADDVNSIYECTKGKYNYVCVTDDPKDLDPNIGILYLEPVSYTHLTLPTINSV